METTTIDNKTAPFIEYPSIDLFAKKNIRKLPKELQDEKWVALEKVHGANFTFLCDGTTIVGARRTGTLDPIETFYNWQYVRDKSKDSIFAAYKLLQPIYPDLTCVSIVGELFGGIYPHPDVPDIGHQPVQRGVYYSALVDFYAFDIKIKLQNGTEFFVDYDAAMKIFEQSNFFYAKPLIQGSLEEALAFNIAEAHSTIPGLLGLPSLQKNIIEGIVVKPVRSAICLPGKKNRAIFKLKNKKFEEINPPAPETIHEKQRNAKVAAVETCYSEVDRYINENRLHSVESKWGPVTKDNVQIMSERLNDDVFKDFIKDNEETWTLVAEGAQEQIVKNTLSKIRVFVNDYVNKQ